MFGRTNTTSRRHTAHAHAHASDHAHAHTSTRKNRIRGLKAAINNPRTTGDGRSGAQAELRTMGVKPTKPSLGTRIRHFLGLGGKSRH